METPEQVHAIHRPERNARPVLDDGGLFVAVDGGDSRLVRRVLEMTMTFAAAGAEQHGPAIAELGAVPLCYGSVRGRISALAREPAMRLLRAAGYSPR